LQYYTTAELSSATFANPFARTYTQSVLRIETLKAPLHSCKQQSVSSSQFPFQMISLNLADIPSSLLSLELKDALAGSVI
jgi:hypothetical protein